MVQYTQSFLHTALVLAPVWIPIFLISFWLSTWIHYKRREWILKQGSVLLEIKLPRDIPRNPAAMELVLNGLFEPIVGNLIDVYFNGRVRDWFSLEIISDGGQVRFFIWALPKWKKVVETRIYGQYPNAEVHEVKDYTSGVHFDPKTMSMFGIQSALTKSDVYPIKTYIDYGLDKKGDEEEEKIDPLTPLIEWLGSLKPGERCWIQIMIQSHRAEKGAQDVKLFPKPAWNTLVKKEIQKIYEDAIQHPDADKKPGMMDLSGVQKDIIESIQRNQGKLAYDTMVRSIYFAKKEDYNSMAGLGLVGSMRQFGSYNMNGIKPIFSGIDYPWQDFRATGKTRHQLTIFDAYKRRSTFNGPYKNWNAKPYVLSTEELATLFHFPGAIATTPTLSRIPSKKAEAPANLPV